MLQSELWNYEFAESCEHKSRALDKFYTNRDIAQNCYNIFAKFTARFGDSIVLLEPSAGDGAFLDAAESNIIGLDIAPERGDIIAADFLTCNIKQFLPADKKIAIIGNPPFGKNSSLAIKFLNRAFDFTDIVGFILPKTFQKKSVQNRINLNFSCVHEHELPANSFLLDGTPYNVPCVFQIWQKSAPRKIVQEKSDSQLFYFTIKENADFAVRRVGGVAGRIFEDFQQYQAASNYFIKSRIEKSQLKKLFVDSYEAFQMAANRCAGNPSLSKKELVAILDNYKGQ